MAQRISGFSQKHATPFREVVRAFGSNEGLPFAHILSAERIGRLFAKHNGLFGLHGIYNTALVVWAFLSQVLRDGKEASCRASIARITSYCQQMERAAPAQDTGDYCRARAKLPEAALHELGCEVAEELEQTADAGWLWMSRHHAKLIDGFTFTMPDTPENQSVYPQQKTQEPGVGLPIARAVALLSLATACVTDLAMGPYAGKETGEPALLRSMLGSLHADDIAVADRYYCSFMTIALLLGQGTQVCARKHQRRHSDFRRGRRLGKHDHIIVWTRPQRPAWMDEETYARIPEYLELREIQFTISVPGRRTQTIEIITTLLDADAYSKEDIAELYGFRWHSELDIRSIKANLNLAHVRCKSPEMVRREVWTTMLGYNLIRTTAAGAALLHDRQPRKISFTGTCQYVLASWMQLSTGSIDAVALKDYLETMLKHIAYCEVGNRPGRIEPRVLKRRRHGYPLMQKPRSVLQRELVQTHT
jgi:hypothetical protein